MVRQPRNLCCQVSITQNNTRCLPAYQGDIEAADRYSRLSLRLLEAYGAKEWQARVCVVVYGMVSPLKHPVRGTLEPLHAAHRSSLVLGDIHVSSLWIPQSNCANFSPAIAVFNALQHHICE
jgi:hypothetical protein